MYDVQYEFQGEHCEEGLGWWCLDLFHSGVPEAHELRISDYLTLEILNNYLLENCTHQ